jgi:recombinational DNA repair ATPase RecF
MFNGKTIESKIDQLKNYIDTIERDIITVSNGVKENRRLLIDLLNELRQYKNEEITEETDDDQKEYQDFMKKFFKSFMDKRSKLSNSFFDDFYYGFFDSKE